MNRRYYFTAYDQVVSMNKDQTIKFLTTLLETGGYDLYKYGKILKKELTNDDIEMGGFYKNKIRKEKIVRFPSIVNDWDYGKEIIEELLTDINGKNDNEK